MTAKTETGPRPVRTAALVTGVVFLLVGILGFVPGVTTGYEHLQFAGMDSGARLFGVFTVSILHNIVHLLFGVAGVVTARAAGAARGFLIIGGGVYLVLWVYGWLSQSFPHVNFVPFDRADNWLHLGLGAAMIAAGILTTRAENPRRR